MLVTVTPNAASCEAIVFEQITKHFSSAQSVVVVWVKALNTVVIAAQEK